MNCQEFEMMLAEALGDELREGDRQAFDAHAAECARCRSEFASLRRTVTTLQMLPAAQGVRLERVGDQLILSTAACGLHPPSPLTRWFGALVRYAACVVLAFAAGYSLHPERIGPALNWGPRAPRVVSTGSRSDSLQAALTGAYGRNPTRSDLAKCLIAMYDAPARDRSQ